MLNQSDADIIFPVRVIPALARLRGPAWQELVRMVLSQPEASFEVQVFILMMLRLDGCLNCHANSHRAMLGCTQCATQRISRYKGSDADLLKAYEQARTDLDCWMQTGEIPAPERLSAEEVEL